MSRTLGDMNCEQTEKLIADHLDGELSEADAELFEHHLAQCDRCRQRYDRAEACVRQVAAALQPSEQFAERVMAGVREVAAGGEASTAPREARPLAPVGRPSWRLWLSRPAVAMAAAALVAVGVVIGFWLLRPVGPGEPRSPRDHIVTPAPTTGPGQRVQSAGIPLEAKRSEERRTEIAEKPLTGARLALAPAAFGRVTMVSGDASIKRESAQQWRAASEGQALRAGDAIKTGSDSSLLARFGDGSSIDLAGDTEVALDGPSDARERPRRATLARGDIMVAVVPGGGEFEVETPLAVAGVLGTKFSVEATARKAVLTVFEGTVEFRNELGRVTAEAMERSVAAPGHPPTEPHRVVGRKWGQDWSGNVYGGKWTLHDGGHLHVSDEPHSRAEVERIRERLRTSPGTRQLLAEVLDALWSEGGGVRVSVECARELAEGGVRLADLRHSQLGIVLPLSKEEGAVGIPVFHVIEDSPVAKAGLQEDDVIVSVNDESVDTETQLSDQLRRVEPGSDVEVAFIRDAQTQTLTVTTGEGEPTGQELALIAALRVLEGQPKHVEARIVVANARVCLGHSGQATAEYEALLVEYPDNAAVINNLGVMAVLEDRLGDGLQRFERATQLAPEFEGAWTNLTGVYRLADMHARERALLQLLVERHPDWEGPAAQLAHFYRVRREAVDRIEEFRRLAQRHPKNVGMACALARVLAQADRKEEAKRACEHALGLGLAYPAARETLAHFLLPADEAAKVTAEMLKAWAPRRHPFIYIDAGIDCYGKHNMPEKALAALEKGVKLDPANSTGYEGYLWHFLGERYRAAGRHAEALDCFVKAGDLEPEWATPWRSAGDAAEAAGQANQADEHYEKAIQMGLRHGAYNPDNLALALKTAMFRARRASHLGHEDQEERYGRLALEAAEKAEALAHEQAPELYVLLGREYHMRRQDWTAMKRAFQKALDLAPRTSAGGIIRAGELLNQTGLYALILDVLAMALALEPEVAGSAQLGRAVDILDRGTRDRRQSDLALRTLTPLIDRLQDSSFVRTAVAAMHVYAGAGDLALRELDMARSGAAGDSFYFWQVKAAAEEAAGHRDEAVAAAVKTIEVMPPNRYERYHSMAVLKRLDPAAGAKALGQRIAAGLSGAGWHRDRGLLLEAAGDMEGAEADLRQAASLSPEWNAHYLTTFYMRRGRPGDAEKAARSGLKTNPPGDTLHARYQAVLATALAAQGKWDDAVEHAYLSLRALEGSRQTRYTVQDALATFDAAVQHGATAGQAAKMREALLLCLEAIDREAVGTPNTTTQNRLWQLVDSLEATGEREQQAQHWLRILQLRGRTSAARQAQVKAARGFSSLAPDRARQHFQELAAKDPTSDLPWLGLYWATKQTDPEAAVHAAIQAVGRADADADPDAYQHLAEFLAEADPAGGLKAFAARADETDELAGPVAFGLARLAAAAQDWEQLQRAVDALLQGEDDDLAYDAAMLLSGLGRHTEAMALMEHAVRLDPMGDGNRILRALRLFVAAGHERDALALCEEIAAKSPDDYMMALKMAGLWFWAGDRAKWRQWLERAQALFKPPHPEKWLVQNWAMLHLADGNLAEARRSYERAGALFASGSPQRREMTQALARIDSLREAMEPVDTLCRWVREELSPEAAGRVLEAALAAGEAGRALMAVAEALATLAEEEPDRARAWAEKLGGQYPGNAAAVFALANLASADTDPERAKEAARRALQVTGAQTHEAAGDADSWAIYRAWLTVVAEDWDQLPNAVDALLQGEDDDLAYDAAMLLSGLGRHTEAMALMEHAVRLDPMGDGNRILRARRVFVAAGHERDALALCEEIAAKSPDDYMMALKMTGLWFWAGDRAKWRQWLERAQALFKPPHPEKWLVRKWARLHLAEGNLAQAGRSYERVQELFASTTVDGGEARRILAGIDSLGETAEPVDTLCQWVREELSPEAAGQVLEAALAAAEAGSPMASPAEGLSAIAEEHPVLALQWAQRLAERYPDDPAVLRALAEMTSNTPPDGAKDAPQQGGESEDND